MFFIKDHLGSVRAVVSETGEVLQTNEYYPYGDLFGNSGIGSSGNRFRFTGKELSDETGLYDFSARYLQTSLGRFTTIDPLAEKYPSISPYAYCNGNPVRYIDPDGRYFDETNDKRAQRMERRLERKAEKLSAKAERKENRHKDSGDLRERAGELCKSVQDIRDMRDDRDIEYRYVRTISEPESKSGDDGNSKVMYLRFQNFQTKIHESRHGGQHARGEMNLATKQGYGVRDEIDAYRAQYSWFGKLQYQTSFLLIDTITEIGKVDSNFVHAIFENGHALYPPEGMRLKDWYNN